MPTLATYGSRQFGQILACVFDDMSRRVSIIHTTLVDLGSRHVRPRVNIRINPLTCIPNHIRIYERGLSIRVPFNGLTARMN